MTGSATIVHGNALHLPLADNSVDLVVTSPPFLNLRSYQDGGQHMDGQIGTGSQAQFLDSLWEVTAECMRVLKPAGSIWVELGDSYTNKSLNNSPHRYAIGCTDKLGLIQRAEVIWSRPNGLPESVTDRVRRSHSVWFHFTKEPRYYSAVDEIREDYCAPHATRTNGDSMNGGLNSGGPNGRRDAAVTANPLGKLPGSVWSVPTQPLMVPAHLGIDHFAAFPFEFPRRIIRGWSPADGVVLDPFSGTGTTALVAKVLGRHGIGVDLSADYCRLAEWRTNDPGQIASAMEVEKPPVEVSGQFDLFEVTT